MGAGVGTDRPPTIHVKAIEKNEHVRLENA